MLSEYVFWSLLDYVSIAYGQETSYMGSIGFLCNHLGSLSFFLCISMTVASSMTSLFAMVYEKFLEVIIS